MIPILKNNPKFMDWSTATYLALHTIYTNNLASKNSHTNKRNQFACCFLSRLGSVRIQLSLQQNSTDTVVTQ